MAQENPRNGSTRWRLQETEFFLGHLRPKYGKNQKFDFYLNAFLGAGRSVLWMMKAEYKRVTGWKAWYNGRRLSPDEERLFRGIAKLRNRSLKTSAIRSLKAMAFSVDHSDNPEHVEARNLIDQAIRDKRPAIVKGYRGGAGNYTVEVTIGERRVKLPAREVQVDRGLPEFPGEHILTVCGRYYAVLAAIVKECEAKFS